MNLYEYLKEESGFKPCPICERLDRVRITTRSNFYETAGERGYHLVTIRCERCYLELWGHDCKSRNYGTHRNYIKNRWNKMWTRGEGESNAEDLCEG